MASSTDRRSYPRTLKPMPVDFEEVFIRTGWRGIEEAYGARTGVNKRWVREAGEDELKRKRKSFLNRLRNVRVSAQHRHEAREPAQPVSIEVQEAIQFLRSREGGAWLITATGTGDYWFGSTRKSAAEIVERASRHR